MSDDLTHSKLERGIKMTKRQNFKLDDERNNIDFSSLNFPKLEEMNEFIAKAFEELISDTVACKARIDFQVLQYDNEETLFYGADYLGNRIGIMMNTSN